MSTVGTARDLELVQERTLRKVQWRLLPLVVLLYLIAMIDRSNIGYAALDMNKALGINSAAFGLLSGIFYLGYIPCEIPSNMILHLVGARRWFCRIMVSWGAVVIITGLAHSVRQLYVLRVLLGAAEAGLMPGVILYMSFWFTAKVRARAVACFMTAMPISNFIGAPLATSIMRYVHWFGLDGWRWVFILEGVPAILMGIFVLFFLTDRPEQAKWLAEDERNWLVAEKRKEHQATVQAKQYTKLQALLSPRVLRLALIYFTLAAGQVGISLWLPTILKGLSKALTNTQVGLIAMIPYFCATLAMLLWSRHSDRAGERKFHAALGPLAAAIGLLAFGLSTGVPCKVVGITITLTGIYCFFGPFWTLPTQFLSEGSAAVGIATVLSLGMFAGFVGPFAIGYLASRTGNINAGLYFLCGLLFLTFLLLVTMRIPSDKRT
jgi:ACS family tartrate transporter-like MFS transporter